MARKLFFRFILSLIAFCCALQFLNMLLLNLLVQIIHFVLYRKNGKLAIGMYLYALHIDTRRNILEN